MIPHEKLEKERTKDMELKEKAQVFAVKKALEYMDREPWQSR